MTMTGNAPKSKLTGLIQLGLALVVVWLMVGYICPAIIEAIPPFKRYADELHRRGIHGGALFYTNVEENTEADLQMSNTIRFLPKGPQPDVQKLVP